MSRFSENLKLLRLKKNINQAQVAEHISTSLTQIRRWESGQTSPSIDNAALLAKFYKVSLDELYGLDKATTVIDVATLSKKQIAAVKMIVECF